MRASLIILLALKFSVSSAQKSPYFENHKTIQASMASLSDHELLTQVTYFDLNFVKERIDKFMRRNMSMSLIENSIRFSTSEIKESYRKGVQANSQVDAYNQLTISYRVFPFNNSFVIREMEVTGFSEYALDFFVRYWNTELNFEDLNPAETAFNYLLQDRISLTFNEDDTATIKVINTTITNQEAFIASN